MNIYHPSRLVSEYAASYGDRIAMRYRDYTDGRWKGISWKELNGQVNYLCAALLDFGIKEHEKVGIFAQNMPECIVSEFSIFSLRAVSVPMYATSTTSQIEYIISDAGIRLMFVGEQYQYDRAFEALSHRECGLKQIVVFDTNVRLQKNDDHSIYFKDFVHKGMLLNLGDSVEVKRSECRDDDLANILYTSGTTGEPKGVQLLHSNYQEIVRVMDIKLLHLFDKNEVSMCFLPLTHIFEKAWSLYCFSRLIRVDINLKPLDIQRSLKEVRPTIMCNVPRFWEKVYSGIMEKIDAMPALAQKWVFHAVKLGKRYHLDYRRLDIKPPFWLSLRYNLYRVSLFTILKKAVGLENGKLFPVSGAKLSDDILIFMRSVGIPICYGYGLTETTATVASFDEKHFSLGSVGSFIDKLQVRIDDNGEILLKGETITPGYYNKPEINAKAFTEDGFFRTGDMGYINKEGHLVLTERLKDLFKTSNGKYIAPQSIEAVLCNDKYINMVAVIGDQRKFVSALIVPAYEELKNLAVKLGIPDLDADKLEDVLKDERIYAFFENRIRMLQKNMAGYEQIRRFVLLPKPFSVADGELTNTLKMKRNVIADHYKDEIEKMYL
ncbi:MAG TPA: long-chain fatty acid--CoA ligase [Bacteroidales bacterium]|nr:long-chain fatty acid--CoA ligase [Bacteroidales bacterium]